ncbi:MAG: hypothetical protein BGO43_13080 [Gammaproteobacteria bacterium 39-13]|nr:hypothetical protein [Gammaproteobacteria bacterium]OJV92715.1 MAG: hypothetical protein BGO43_13080 [Gammaproteobacteria bacterium 39-13]
MSNIKSLCKRVKNTFSDTLSEKPLSAILMLGNLYVSLKHANPEEESLLIQTLSKLKASLTEKQVNRLWGSILSISPKRLGLMTSSNRKSINKLKYEMACDIEYLQHIDIDDLIKAGQSVKFYRFILIAVIRHNLQSKGLSDPFEEEKFDFDALKAVSAEQSECLAEVIKKCPLPSLKVFQALGQKSEIAELLLIDLKDCDDIFEISTAFAQQHPSLREEIAENWKSYLETYELTSAQEKFLTEELPKLKKKFPEFKIVELDSRIRRDNQIEIPHPDRSYYRAVCEGGLSGVASSFGITSGLAQLGFVLSVPAYAVSLPVCVGMHLGLNWMFQRSKENKRETMAPEKESTKREKMSSQYSP